MAQLLFEKIELIKSMILSFTEYDMIILDTGAGIAEVVLQFNLLATRNIVIINRELTCLTDAYSMIKVMFQVFGRDDFSVVVNSAADEKEADNLYAHLHSICEKFLGVHLHYLGFIARDDLVPKSIVKQELLVLAAPGSRICQNFNQIAGKVLAW
jgi:flagellar biosynthesis protein FlhG